MGGGWGSGPGLGQEGHLAGHLSLGVHLADWSRCLTLCHLHSLSLRLSLQVEVPGESTQMNPLGVPQGLLERRKEILGPRGSRNTIKGPVSWPGSRKTKVDSFV